MSIRMKMLYFLLALCFSGRSVSGDFFPPNQLPCDPFDSGTTSEAVQAASYNPVCACTYPCTVDKVGEFVRFYSIKKGQNDYSEVDIKNPSASKLFNSKQSIKFIVPGYTTSALKGWVPPTGQLLSKVFNGYVIIVDYGPIASCGYERTVLEIVPAVAAYVANAIRVLNLDLQNVELIGHSIGGHLVGYVGAFLKGAVRRITALDPAAPGYDALRIGLNSSCAQFVQVLHTDPEDFGTDFNRGHADFWANNRTQIQPGCPDKRCGHAKAFYFYFASLFPQNKFIGMSCQALNVTCSNCTQSSTSRFGLYNDGKIGQFCFDTTACFPYAQTLELPSQEKHSNDKKKIDRNCTRYGKSKTKKRCKRLK